MTTPDLSWDLSGRLSVSTHDLHERQVRDVVTLLDPYTPALGTSRPDVLLRGTPAVQTSDLEESHGPARDGLTTARHRDGRLLVRYGRHWASVPSPADSESRIDLESGLRPSTCWADVVRPTMHQRLHHRGAVAVHSAAVQQGDRATLLAGWSESGKTEVALALVERGAGFLSDKWTVAGADGEVSAFPVSVGVRGWVLEALPTLRSSLPPGARSQLAAARALGAATRRMRTAGARGRVLSLATHGLTRAVELGDRVAVNPSALRQAYGDTSDPARRLLVGTVVVLVNTSGAAVRVEDRDPGWAAARLARTAAYERRGFFDLQERGAYAGVSGRARARDTSLEQEEALLQQAFDAADRVVRVSCPFPGDPRRVADALAAS